MRYRRATTAGGTYFFTVNLADRSTDMLVSYIATLRKAFNDVKRNHPFVVVAMVVLPEHLHTIWRLPPDDADYPKRWALIKAGFSRELPHGERLRPSRTAKRERGIWQRRYWEHQIRDQADLDRHVDYIHFNPVKHGWVQAARDWPFSTLHRYVELGRVAKDWGGGVDHEPSAFGER